MITDEQNVTPLEDIKVVAIEDQSKGHDIISDLNGSIIIEDINSDHNISDK